MTVLKKKAQPDGNSTHYVLEHDEGDRDMRLRNANGQDEASYHLHVVLDGEPSDEHLVLHTGVTTSSTTPVAAAIYTSSAAGIITTPTLPVGPLNWDTPRNATYSTLTASGRALRWCKSYPAANRIPILGRKPAGITWTLTDVTAVQGSESSSLSTPVGDTLATLTLAPLQGKRSRAEVGNLVWFADAERSVRDAAIMMVLALWHRDRQILAGVGLGPRGDVDVVGRTAGKRVNAGMANLGVGEASGVTVAW